jgi:predicted aldo/keto reductase-like oxidoreductase
MQYRPFGNTGVMVSALGFGAMRLPTEEETAVHLVQKAIDLGVNYVDTAPGYLKGQSEVFVGKAIKNIRNKVYLSTKNPIENASADDWWKRMEASLERLDTDYIDFYHMWGINWEVYSDRIVAENGPLKAARRAQEEGIIKHLCFSFHDIPENMIKLIDTGEFETVLCQYNLLDRANEEAMAHARERGLGVAVMGPVGGGRLSTPSQAIGGLIGNNSVGTPEVALRFVLANPNVSVALSGMSTDEMIEQNVRIASMTQPLGADEKESIEASLLRFAELSKLYCTGCNYCMPCPMGVKIPRVFELMNLHRVWGLTDTAKSGYQKLVKKGGSVDPCVLCGNCESKCPQEIKIIEQLQECAALLGA